MLKVEEGYIRNLTGLETFAAEISGFQPASGSSWLIVAVRCERDSEDRLGQDPGL